MVIETWEVAMRKVVESQGLIAGYSYKQYIGGHTDIHSRDCIPIMVETKKKILCVGVISYGDPSMSVYGRVYVKDMEELAVCIKEELGFQYKPILRREQPELTRVKGFWRSLLWKAFGVEP